MANRPPSISDCAWRVVNVWAYDEDEGDVDMDALGEAITALHAALEASDVDDWVNPTTGHGPDCGCIACHMSQVQ